MLDESLAKGLKNTLWRAAQEEFKRIVAIARQNENRPAFATRKGARRGIDLIEKKFATPLRLANGRREGRKPLWWFVMLTMDENIAVNEWQENVFGFCFAGERFLPHHFNFCDLRSRISEHAVSRLYQRAPKDGELPLLDSIYPELTCAALHGYWHFLALRLLHDDGEPFTAFVPTDTGAFLGEMSKCGGYLDLRTYIVKDQMRPDQLRLWDELKALNIEESARQIFPEHMLEMGLDSRQVSGPLIQSLQKVIKGFPRLLGPRRPADSETSA